MEYDIKHDDSELMYPNTNFLKFFPAEELPETKGSTYRSGCLRAGTYFVLRKIIAEYRLNEMLGDIIGKNRGLFLDLAVYSIIAENNAGQYYPDYAYNLRSRFYTCLKEQMQKSGKKNYMTVPAAIRELGKIELIRQSDRGYRMDYAVTATQKEILKAFNMTAANIKTQAAAMNEDLMQIEKEG